MPIVDVELVRAGAEPAHADVAQPLADALGEVLGTPPGRTWVRVRYLDRTQYAENGAGALAALPVFVAIQMAHWPPDDALDAQIDRLTRKVAEVLQRPAAAVHVAYAPQGAGRQAFGGVRVR
jgi:phenylpyruvate tautomerase PptA (4-oxalocrotonate tautomerase family)